MQKKILSNVPAKFSGRFQRFSSKDGGKFSSTAEDNNTESGSYIQTPQPGQKPRTDLPNIGQSKFSANCNCSFLLQSCLGMETAKGPFGFRVKLLPAHLFTTYGGCFALPLFIAERQKGIINIAKNKLYVVH